MEGLRNRAFFRDMLRRSGFVESLSNAIEPTQVGQFLGLKINMKQRLMFIPYDKLIKIIKMLEGLIACRRVPVREVSKVARLVISCMLAVGHTLMLLCRGIYQLINEAKSFNMIKSLYEISAVAISVTSKMSCPASTDTCLRSRSLFSPSRLCSRATPPKSPEQ